MAVKQVALASRWMSATDIVERLRQARENRERQVTLLDGLERRVKQRREEVERSLVDLPASQRSQFVSRAANGHRGELKRQSADGRLAHVHEANRLRDAANSAACHYQSPTQMLMRDSLGSERRSRLLHQIEKSGPAELSSLAALAAATRDKELGAALCTRISGLAVNDRPFSSRELADALVGEDYRRIAQAMMEIERLAVQAASADAEFETGRSNPTKTIQAALMRRKEAAVGVDLTDLDATDDQPEE